VLQGVTRTDRLSRGSDPRRARWLTVSLGGACVAAGVWLVLRPFTSLALLVLAVGIAAVVTGVLRWATAGPHRKVWDHVVAAGWVTLGVAVLVWPDISVDGIARVVGVGMIVGGVADGTTAARRGTWDGRV